MKKEDNTYYKFKECCKVNTPAESYGPAITDVSEVEFQPNWDKKSPLKEGTLWAGNGEYNTQVNFCPMCGKKAKVTYEKSNLQ